MLKKHMAMDHNIVNRIDYIIVLDSFYGIEVSKGGRASVVTSHFHHH